MVSVRSEPAAESLVTPAAVKIVIAGGFGAGKTTMVASVSEIPPLRTEEILTEASAGVDDLAGVEQKGTTTVALDFGRITISPELVLYLFGTPGQERFWFMWNELAAGAIGAVIIVDTRRVESSFPSIDFFEHRSIPFVVAVNRFDNSPAYTADEVRKALDLDPQVPIVLADARERDSSKGVLIELLEYAIRQFDRFKAPTPAIR